MVKVYLGLGSNMGNCPQNLQTAMELLRELPGVELTKASSMYKTNPVGYLDQSDFYNCVVEIITNLNPEELLVAVLAIEKQMHRIREFHWGPRTIDIDILLYGEEVVKSPQLCIPHPRMHDRGFVVIPLNEIAEDLLVPGLEYSVKSLIERLPQGQRVEVSSVQFSNEFGVDQTN